MASTRHALEERAISWMCICFEVHTFQSTSIIFFPFEISEFCVCEVSFERGKGGGELLNT